MTNAVEVRHLSKSIEGCPILNDICMNVRQGKYTDFWAQTAQEKLR